MVRLFVLVEGDTEERFVNRVLAPHLYGRGFQSVSARLIGKERERKRRGGMRSWQEVRKEILRRLQSDRGVVLTTMVDYYGMPCDLNSESAWPGRYRAGSLPFDKKADCVESSLAADISTAHKDIRRFIPFVLMHEFEALLFSDCRTFAKAIEREDLADRLQEIRDKYASPEEINDSPETHPSSQIKKLMPNYRKPLRGSIAALEIGLECIRAECPHFRAWLERLEQVI